LASWIIEESLKELRSALEISRSVDGFLIRLDSVIASIEEKCGKEHVKEFLRRASKEGLLDGLAYYKETTLSLAKSPRFPALRRNIENLAEVLETASRIRRFKVVKLAPSPDLHEVTWGIPIRVPRKRRKSISLKSLKEGKNVQKLIGIAIISLLVIAILLMVIP